MSEQANGRHTHCPTCSAGDVDADHVNACAKKRQWLERAEAAGAKCDVPDVTTRDLLAHVAGRCHNDVAATLVVEAVLDLGWRPVIGSDPKRLWTADGARLDEPTAPAKLSVAPVAVSTKEV